MPDTTSREALVDDDADNNFEKTREREPQVQLRAFEHQHCVTSPVNG